MKRDYKEEEEVFFDLVRAGLWAGDNLLETLREQATVGRANANDIQNLRESVDWGEVYRLAEEQSVVGLVSAGLEQFQVSGFKFQVPQAVRLQFIGQTLQIEQRNKAMNEFVEHLIEKLRQNDIYALVVKGQGIAQCYERPLWRGCGDVDLFLSDDNYEKAKKLLVPLATEVETEYIVSKHLGLTIDGWMVELHGTLRVGLPDRINRELDAIQMDTFNNGNVRSWMNGQTQVFMLGKENDIVYVFVHFFNHFYKEGVGLRQICDWCRLMWMYRDEIDVKKIENSIKKMGLVKEWKAFYNLASRYLGMPDLVHGEGFMVKDSRFDKKADRIMKFVLETGNMGHNRDMSHFSKKPYLVRKCVSMGRRVSDLINHARIFPLDSLRFFPRIMWNGVRSVVRGE